MAKKKEKKQGQIKKNSQKNFYGKRKTKDYSKFKYKELMSIKLLLTISHVVIAVLPAIVVALLLYFNGKASITDEVTNANLAVADQMASNIELKTEAITASSMVLISSQDVLSVISKNESNYDNLYYMLKDREDKIYNMTLSLQSSQDDILSIAFIKEDEVIERTKQEFYSDENFGKEFFASETYAIVDGAKSKPVWFYGLFDQDNLFFMRRVKSIYSATNVSVLTFMVDPDYILDEFEAESLGAGSIMNLMDESGKVVLSTHPDRVMGSALDVGPEIIEYISNQEPDENGEISGAFITNKNVDEEKMVVYHSTNTGFYYVSEIPTKSIFSGIQAMGSIASWIVFACLVIALIIGRFLAVIIVKPIDYIRTIMHKVENGDLTVRSNFSGKYEMGQLASSFNQMTMNMANLIEETIKISNVVSDDSQELSKIAQQSAMASKEVITAVESLSEGATEQAHDADTTADVIRQLVGEMNKTEESFNEVVNVTSRTKQASNEASRTIQELNETTKETIKLSGDIKTDMDSLANKFKDILGIIDMINAISSQTNLLALNAAIEAARAGDAGKGFAVVADEVRKLASQSSDAAKDISDIVNSIYTATKDTGNKIEEGSEIYARQEDAVKNTEKTFLEIVNDMDNIMKEVDVVYELLAGLDSIQTNATDSVTSIAAIAQESASAIEEVLATGEEQTAAADHMQEMASKMSDIIEEMKENIKKFTI